jgi:hypothetical protein
MERYKPPIAKHQEMMLQTGEKIVGWKMEITKCLLSPQRELFNLFDITSSVFPERSL